MSVGRFCRLERASLATSLMVMRAVGLRRREHAVGEFHVGRVDLERVRGDRASPLSIDLVGRHVKGRAGHGRRARAAGAFAEEHLVGVALDVSHLVRIEAEPVADDLLEHGLVALALAVRAGKHRRPCRCGRSALRRLRCRRRAARSMVLDMPMPRSLPRLRDFALRALEAFRRRRAPARGPCSFRTRRSRR